MSGEHVCAACPKRLGVSCCEAGEGKLATLTDADVARIREATGWSEAKFTTDEWLSHEDAAAYEEERPLFRGYFRRWPRRRTMRSPIAPIWSCNGRRSTMRRATGWRSPRTSISPR